MSSSSVVDSETNPRVRLGVDPARRSSRRRGCTRILDEDATRIVKQMATTVFLTTAVSQSGRLDALLVLVTQSRMIWRIAHLYYQRPSVRELVHLYSNVAATAFVVGELDDLELHQMIQPVAAGSLGTVAGAIPGFQVMTTIVVNSLLSGSANAFLTLRVGHDRQGLLRLAGRPAAGEVPPIRHGRIGPAALGHRQGERGARPGRDVAGSQAEAASALAVAEGRSRDGLILGLRTHPVIPASVAD